MQRTSQEGLELIRRHEGFSPTPYLCPGGVWTIGYGHTNGVTPGTLPITKEAAEALLLQDIAPVEACIKALARVPLTPNQFSALVSLVFNIGCQAFARSTLLKKLNARGYAGAADEFERWVYAKGRVLPGLTRRRAAEKALFLKEDACQPGRC